MATTFRHPTALETLRATPATPEQEARRAADRAAIAEFMARQERAMEAERAGTAKPSPKASPEARARAKLRGRLRETEAKLLKALAAIEWARDQERAGVAASLWAGSLRSGRRQGAGLTERLFEIYGAAGSCPITAEWVERYAPRVEMLAEMLAAPVSKEARCGWVWD